MKPPDTDELLRRISHGDRPARDQLLSKHRDRLRKFLGFRMDRRLAARVDPSDIVQDVLTEADRKLPDYMRDRPLPFYPWLRQIASDRLIELHRQHVQAGKRSVRREELEVWATLNNLAAAYDDAGRFSEAIRLYEQVSKKQEEKLGADHPDTLATLNNLAAEYDTAGKFPDAIRLLETVRERAEQRLGVDHPHTLSAISNLARAYRSAGQLPEAIRLEEQVLVRREQKLGPDHPDTLDSLNGLAAVCWSAGKLDRSVPLFEELLPRRRRKSGDDHPDTFMTAFNLGVNYRDAGRLDDAVRIFDEWLPRAQAKLHEGQPPLPAGRLMAAQTYGRAGQFDKAVPLIKQAVAEARHNENLNLATALAYLGNTLLRAQQYTEAEKALRECLAIREKKEPDAFPTFIAKSMLGGALMGQKKYADAEPLLLQGYEGIKAREARIPPQGKYGLTEALERLVQLYDAWGKPEKAAQWRARLEAEKANTATKAPPLKEEKKDSPQRHKEHKEEKK